MASDKTVTFAITISSHGRQDARGDELGFGDGGTRRHEIVRSGTKPSSHGTDAASCTTDHDDGHPGWDELSSPELDVLDEWLASRRAGAEQR